MNRNVDSRFSKLPQANIQRSIFDRSHSHKTTFNVGDIVPVLVDEVLPGDTVQIDTSKIVRLQTMLAPIYDNIYLDTYFFFCPSRILWNKWTAFMGENNQSPWAQTSVPNLPLFTAPTGVTSGSVADHFGLPVGIPLTSDKGCAVSALPFVAYDMIYNEFFRDENLVDPVLIDFDNPSKTFNASVRGGFGMPYKAAKYHDYFTSCLPSPQKNTSPVEIPVTGSASGAPATFKIRTGPVDAVTDFTYPMAFTTPVNLDDPSAAQNRPFGANFSGGSINYGSTGDTTPHGNSIYPNNLYVDIGSNVGELTGLGIDVNSMRLAIATQVYYEALARNGSRYEEMLKGFFGVDNPDSRLQHPEYLGGNRIHINVHEITNTAQSETEFLGDVGAQSVTVDSHSDFTKSFTEYGYLIGVVVARYDHSYCQGIPRFFSRTSRFDFYNPVFKAIGEQPVYNKELYVSSSNPENNNKVFGYQEAWADYRYCPNYATGLLRPNVSNALGHWSLTDNYAVSPTLSQGWLEEDKTNVDRCLAVTSSLSDQLFADFYFNAKWTRPMPMYSIPATFGLF